MLRVYREIIYGIGVEVIGGRVKQNKMFTTEKYIAIIALTK